MKTAKYACQDEEYSLPPVEALLAGTLALMTGYAQHHAGCDIRPLMAGKLVSNLSALARHPDISEPMQTLLARLSEHWGRAASPAWEEQAGAGVGQRLHAAPATVQ